MQSPDFGAVFVVSNIENNLRDLPLYHICALKMARQLSPNNREHKLRTQESATSLFYIKKTMVLSKFSILL